MTRSTTLPSRIRFARRQRGVALFVSLVLLIVLTLMGVTALQVTALQERMAGNVREHDIAFQRAEAGLRVMEQGIIDFIVGNAGTLPGYAGASWPTWVQAGLSPFDCSMESAHPDLNTYPHWRTVNVADFSFDAAVIDLTDFRDGADGAGRGSNCRPMDEGTQDASGFYYLINVRADGPAGTGRVVLQSIFFWPN